MSFQLNVLYSYILMAFGFESGVFYGDLSIQSSSSNGPGYLEISDFLYVDSISEKSNSNGISVSNINIKNVTIKATIGTTLYLDSIVNISNTINATSYTSGSLIVSGGSCISKDLYVKGRSYYNDVVTIESTAVSNSVSTGALIVTGGVGITGNLYAGIIYSNGVAINNLYTAGTNISIVSNTISVINNPSFSGQVIINNTSASVSTVTGALVISGGLGISGTLYGTNIYSNGSLLTNYISGSNLILTGTTFSVSNSPNFSGNVSISSTSQSNSVSTGSITTLGGVGISGNVYVGGIINSTNTSISTSNITGSLLLSGGIGISNTVDAVSSTNGGSLTTAGGMSIAKSLYIGNNLNITGNLNVSGSSTQIGVVNITNTTVSTNTSTGALIISGGVGISGNLYAANIYSNGVQVSNPYTTGSNINITSNVISVVSNPTFSGITTISNTSDSISSNSGALVISGGVGINKSLNVGINLFVTGSVTGTWNGNVINVNKGGTGNSSFTPGYLLFGSGTSPISTDPNIIYNGSSLIISNTTASTSTTTGALIISGGLGMSGNIYASNIYSNGVLLNNSGTGGGGSYSPGTNISISGSVISVVNNPIFSGITSITNTTVSTSTTTGSLKVSGGVGIKGGMTIGSNINMTTNRVINSAEPIASQDLATKNYVDTKSAIYYFNNANNVVSTTATYFVSIPGLSLSLPTGTYLIWVNAQCTTTGDINYALFKDNTIIPNTTSIFTGEDSSYDICIPINITGTQVVDLRWQSSIGTRTVNCRSILALSVQGIGGGSSSSASYTAGTNVSLFSDTISVIDNPIFSGITSITDATISTSTSTGALTVAGGVGIVGKIYNGGGLDMGNNTINNVADPIINSDVATKYYVDNKIIPNYSVSANNNTSTTSLNFVQLNNMSITPVAGTYMVTASAHGYKSNLVFSIFVNGVEISNSRATLFNGSSNSSDNTTYSHNEVVTISSSVPIAIYWHVSNNSGTVNARSLVAIKLA